MNTSHILLRERHVLNYWAGNENLVLSMVANWVENGSPILVREFQIMPGGNRKILLASCQSLQGRDGSVMGNLLQIRDITMSTLMEEQMRRMERYTGLGSLLGGLHHEIRNPLAALSLHVQLLEEQLEIDGTTDQSRSMLGIIRTELTRIGGVLEAFRDFASVSNLDLTTSSTLSHFSSSKIG